MLRKSKSSAAFAPTVTSTLTGPQIVGQPMCKDDVKMGVPSMRRRMMMVTMTTMTGGTAEIPDRVGHKFEAPLEKNKAEFFPLGVVVSSPLGSGLVGGGGSQNANDRAGQSS
jgi:hypothetical protein